MNLAILVMAAGLGRRFAAEGGGQKLLAELDGIPVITHSLINAASSGMDLYVVTRPEDVSLHGLIHPGQLIYCLSNGLGESIAAGVQATSGYDGWILALGDMPWIKSDIFHAVAGSLNQYKSVRPVIDGKPGHPVGFRHECLADLVALKGDNGAREVLKIHPPHKLLLKDSGCLRDIDKPEDLSQHR